MAATEVVIMAEMEETLKEHHRQLNNTKKDAAWHPFSILSEAGLVFQLSLLFQFLVLKMLDQGSADPVGNKRDQKDHQPKTNGQDGQES